MAITKRIFTLVLLSVLQLAIAAPRSEDFVCRLPLEHDRLSSPQISNEKGILAPYHNDVDGKFYVEIPSGDKFKAFCPSKEIRNRFDTLDEDTLNLECISGSMVKTYYGIQNFTDLLCKQETLAGETVVRTGTCYNGYTEAQIRFQISTPISNYTLITVCHNEELDETLYSKHFIYGALLDGAESGGTRPSFKEADFFPEISTDTCYTQASQTEAVGILVGSASLAREYIQTGKNLFFSRGHLTPNGDPILRDEKHATFYFINCSPQWQTINGGNWEKLESKIRSLALSRSATFTVWTGSYGVLTLDDVNGKPVEIWLGRDSQGNILKKLPVNKYTWKVIFDESKNQAIAVIQINNPWITVTKDDILCPDLCPQLSWVSWDAENVVQGYTFCCDVASFKEAVPYAPDFSSFGNVTLLN